MTTATIEHFEPLFGRSSYEECVTKLITSTVRTTSKSTLIDTLTKKLLPSDAHVRSNVMETYTRTLMETIHEKIDTDFARGDEIAVILCNRFVDVYVKTKEKGTTWDKWNALPIVPSIKEALIENFSQ